MNRTTLISVAAGVFLLLSLYAGQRALSYSSKLAVAQQQIHEVRDSATAAARAAHTAEQHAADALRGEAQAKHERDSLRIARTQPLIAAHAADSAAADSAVALAADTCAPVIAALQREAHSNLELAFAYKDDLTREVAAHERTKLALVVAHNDLTDAQRAFAGLAARADAVVLPKPSFLSRLLPEADLGCTAGVSPLHGGFDAVCGVSLGWAVKL